MTIGPSIFAKKQIWARVLFQKKAGILKYIYIFCKNGNDFSRGRWCPTFTIQEWLWHHRKSLLWPAQPRPHVPPFKKKIAIFFLLQQLRQRPPVSEAMEAQPVLAKSDLDITGKHFYGLHAWNFYGRKQTAAIACKLGSYGTKKCHLVINIWIFPPKMKRTRAQIYFFTKINSLMALLNDFNVHSFCSFLFHQYILPPHVIYLF